MEVRSLLSNFGVVYFKKLIHGNNYSKKRKETAYHPRKSNSGPGVLETKVVEVHERTLYAGIVIFLDLDQSSETSNFEKCQCKKKNLLLFFAHC